MSRLFRVDASKDWENYGKTSPYYGVLSHGKFLGKTEIDDHAKAEFFGSGDAHIDKCLATLADTFKYSPNGKAMDFGCGVGRITNAISKHFSEVVGYDVSKSMIEKAEENSAHLKNTNIRYICTADDFHPPNDEYDFLHCYIVLQHIPIDQGMILIDRMLGSLRDGGVGALHFTFAQVESSLRGSLKDFIKQYSFLRSVYNLTQLKKPSTPLMQMNHYDLNDMFALMSRHGIERFFCDRIDDWGDLGLFVFFEKGDKAKSNWANPRH